MYKRIRKINTVMNYADVIILLVLGIGVGILALIGTVPQSASLVERHGHLESYYFKVRPQGNFSSSYTAIMSLDNGLKFWTEGFDSNKDIAEQTLRKGQELRFYIDPLSKATPIDGAVKGYGLWINGKEFESVNHALNMDLLALHFFFPLSSFLFFGLAIWQYLKIKRPLPKATKTVKRKMVKGKKKPFIEI